MKKKLMQLLLFAGMAGSTMAQPTYPTNGVADLRNVAYAFTNATIVKDPQTRLQNASMLVQDGKIVAIGVGIALPKDAIVIDCKDKFIYPSFIDMYADYGLATPQRQQAGFDFRAAPQLSSNTKGAYGWNQAIKPEIDASKLFVVDDAKAKTLREGGFGTVLTHVKDGIARGTGTVVTLANDKENIVIVKEKASAHYSFSKGTSGQSYPSSMMGSIALLRQTYLDAKWYKNKPPEEGTNLSLDAWNNNQALPQVFDVIERGNADQSTKWNALRADRIAKEFEVAYIIKASGYEYQRISDMAATKASFILPINFPQAMDVEDPNDARFVSINDMKHWELAPTNPAVFEKANISFCLTTADLRDAKQFMPNLRKAIEYGLSENKALEALTKTPATLLGIYDKVGSLEAGKMANFIITSGPVFADKTTLFQNWVQGNKYTVKEEGWSNVAATYQLNITGNAGTVAYVLDVKTNNSASLIGNDTLSTKFSYDGKMVKLSFNPIAPAKRKTAPTTDSSTTKPNLPSGGRFAGGSPTPAATGPQYRLSGVSNGQMWQGTGEDTLGNKLTWTATFIKNTLPKSDSSKRKDLPKIGSVTYPFSGYGWEEMPKQENILIKNTTVWTNEADGKLLATDVLLKNGKIAAIGKNLSDATAKVIDGTGKNLTAGIIDEHSHIAASSINEGGQSVTSEVRIGDNLNPDDVNIYRQLSGGVTTTHILHGSANTIGGQTQLIKLRWGANDEDLKFKNWDPFIKFALGENVKRTTATNGNTRFPDTRMGVDVVLTDAFARATDYQKAIKANPKTMRKDLELDALAEILNKKRFITCHSYVQSEITALMRVAEKYNFTVNTFTHILAGYKVADKMKAHGANASTFSDWWYYKVEVEDAIAYNAAIMHKVGLNVAINSDDAEMARRLNQEAAKSIKYGNLSEEDALKMVTLNPAIMLHVSNRVGSIKVGKDADVVLWSDNPLSIYAKALTTIVDGIVYFDREKDAQLRTKITAERNRLVQKMLGDKKAGFPVVAPIPSAEIMFGCGDHEHKHGLLGVDGEDDGQHQ